MEQKVKKKQNIFVKIITKTILAVLIAVCCLLIYFNATHEYFVVTGPSMTPTLNQGVLNEDESKDSVFVSKIKSYNRGDIIVVYKSSQYFDDGETNKYIIKRIIALSGDKIKVEEINGENRIVLIKNGETQNNILEETYLSNYDANLYLKTAFDAMVSKFDYELDEEGYFQIPEGEIFYLGDNRQNSKDCMLYGSKSVNVIVGKVDYVVYNSQNPYGQVIQQFFGW